ncbi:MAG: hypothetical protein KF789_00035 [Bdellovibrionaceae bacterium]|nr:hypothetical protein [Pseudobdellovibrionaceae bacterium]
MNGSLAKAWVSLGVVALLASGLLAILVTGAKMPGVKHLADVEFIRWCLVVHVNLATLVWFTALPVGLLHLSTKVRGTFSTQLSWAGFLLALIGMLLLFSVPPQEGVRPILSNYIPVLSHPRYSIGIAVYLAGIALGLLSPKFFVDSFSIAKRWPGLLEIRFGLFVGSTFIGLAIVTLALAFKDLASVPLISEFRFFELGMWGGGHLIQHASAVFTVCAWVLFLSRRVDQPILSRSELFVVFGWIGLPIFFVPVILFFDVTGGDYRQGFTWLMQWGIAPPIVFFLGRALWRLSPRLSDLKNHEIVAFFLSASLLLMGFVFGAFIRGPDMRVPGHYHASIGAVTLAFMALGYLLLADRAESRWMLKSMWFYGVGQAVFAGGMFLAGSFGMPRKTYGAEHVFTHWGQGLGVAVMAIGGMGALIGGILFAVAIIPRLKSTAPLAGKVAHV